jgi:predicted TIM-barrel fold metal-dependent hydrolase
VRFESAQWWAAIIRRLGTERVVFGSDATIPKISPGEAWTALRTLLPLSEDEVRAIAANVLPYMQ